MFWRQTFELASDCGVNVVDNDDADVDDDVVDVVWSVFATSDRIRRLTTFEIKSDTSADFKLKVSSCLTSCKAHNFPGIHPAETFFCFVSKTVL